MRSFLLALFGSIFLLSSLCNAQSCTDFTSQSTCQLSGSCTWLDSGLCRCASEVQLDILFNIDASGSIGKTGFITQRNFLKDLVTQGISNGSNIGFFIFSSQVNESRGIQHWDADELNTYIDGLYWTAGYTNTGGVIDASIDEFERTYDPERQQVLMMVTDGNPCQSNRCPYSVCNRQADVLAAGIRVIIIGVGDGLTTQYVDCLCQSDDDFIPVNDFTDDDFNSIMGSLSDVVCPVSKDALITEVKAEKKQSGYDKRYSRYIEIYNSGVQFNVDDIALSGLVTMAHGAGPSVNVSQGQYLVFYDAADDDALVGGESTVTCHLCGSLCGLDACSDAGLTAYTEECWCDNAVYVACNNDGENCPASFPDIENGVEPTDGCNVCTFDDSMDRSNWYIELSDNGGQIDIVEYDSATWITTLDGYAYELIAKGFDNSFGNNWAQTCSVFGTPGTDPSADCDAVCDLTTDCGGGGSCNPSTQICDCDDGYYPQCTSATSCTTCLQVPGIDDCNVTWFKNGTKRYAEFIWTAAERQGTTQYQLTYKSSGDTNLNADTYAVLYRTENYYPLNTSYGGYVQTAIPVCTNTTNGGSVCATYYSTQTACEVYTQSPTASPTLSPTKQPTASPTDEPTQAPTWPCPTYWWTNEDVCSPDQCVCTGDKPNACCMDPDIDWTKPGYDANRTHDDSYLCRLDSDLQFPDATDARGDDQAGGYANGYLLKEGQHNFVIDIEPSNYPFDMDIEWELQFDTISCSYDNGTSDSDCDSGDPSVAGLDVSPLRGNMTVEGAADSTNRVVQIEVTKLECADVNETGTDCFDNTAVYGNLIITRAESTFDATCVDGRIYPMRIPVWFNYAEAFVAPPSDTEELPAWLWWLIAALVVFLGVLAVLVYWYWFKNKKTGAALQEKQLEIDAEVEINENGWQGDLNQNQVGFNPLATGFNPNAPAGAADPNAPLNGGGGGQDFVRPNVEKTVFREQYGPHGGNLR